MFYALWQGIRILVLFSWGENTRCSIVYIKIRFPCPATVYFFNSFTWFNKTGPIFPLLSRTLFFRNWPYLQNDLLWHIIKSVDAKNKYEWPVHTADITLKHFLLNSYYMDFLLKKYSNHGDTFCSRLFTSYVHGQG